MFLSARDRGRLVGFLGRGFLGPWSVFLFSDCLGLKN